MNLFNLFAKIALDTSQYDKGMSDASDKTKTFASAIGNGLSTASRVATAALTTIVAGATAVVTAMGKAVASTTTYGDTIDKMSQKMGMSAESYQEWDFVMQHSGTSMETLQSSMKSLANAVASGNGAFKSLGITVDDIVSMSNEELFSAVITSLQDVENETERTYLAGQLLGRGATELGALLNMTAEETQAMKDRVHELGGVMSDDAVKASAKMKDSLQDMKTAAGGLIRGFTQPFIASITTVVDGITEVFAGDSDKGLGMISDGLDDFSKKMEDAVPKFLDVGGKILGAFVQALFNNLDKILELGGKLIGELVRGLLKNAPKIFDAAIKLLKQLVNEFANAMPELVPQIFQLFIDVLTNVPELLTIGLKFITALGQAIADNVEYLIPAVTSIILDVVEALTSPDTLTPLINAGISMIVAVIKGVIKAAPELIARAPELVLNFMQACAESIPMMFTAGEDMMDSWVDGFGKALDTFKETIPKIISKIGEAAKTWGKDLVNNFISGIKSMANKVGEAVKGIAQKIKDFLGFSEPKDGPLSNFHTYAPDMMKLYAEGIEQNKGIVNDELRDAFDFSQVEPQLPDAKIGGRYSSGGTATYNITLKIGEKEFARAVYRANKNENQIVGLNLAGSNA